MARLTFIRRPTALTMVLEARALAEFGSLLAFIPALSHAPMGDGHPVLVLPALGTGDAATTPLRIFLRSRGYAVNGWRLGISVGPSGDLADRMSDLVLALKSQHGQKVSLVGWSLGGIYARQLAKAVPEAVRSVITLASPFAASVDGADRFFGGSLADKPPVPTTAFFSRTDGICDWQSCIEEDGYQAENIEVTGSHLGMAVQPSVLYAIADRLAQPEGKWKPFEGRAWRRLFFQNALNYPCATERSGERHD